MLQHDDEVAPNRLLLRDAQVPHLLDQIRDIEVVEITCAEQPDLLLDPQAEVALVEPALGFDLRLRACHD
jgi:hypothetical protein